MKSAVYLVTDERDVPRKLTPVIFADPHFEQGFVEAKNVVGWRGEGLVADLAHPDFVDDEEEGVVVLPQPAGLVRLRTPAGKADYEALRLALAGCYLPPYEDDEQMRQALFTLCCAGD